MAGISNKHFAIDISKSEISSIIFGSFSKPTNFHTLPQLNSNVWSFSVKSLIINNRFSTPQREGTLAYIDSSISNIEIPRWQFNDVL